MTSAVVRFIVAAFVCTAALLAQTTSSGGAIRGAAIDPSGAAIPGARVTAAQRETGASRTAATDAAGQFYLGNLPIGQYTVRVEAAGFAPVNLGPFSVSIGQVVEQRVNLQPAGLSESIDVSDRPEAIDVAASTASVALGGERIEEAPARSRNYLNFVLAAPGVASSAGASSQRSMTGVRAPLGDSGFTFAGMRPRNNAILIDGMDNRDETTGGNRVAVGLEMVQEFRVAGSAIGAELGGAAGGLLNMVTRSGVNMWHGDFTFFAQNELFNARRPEIDTSFTPRFERSQPGASIMGPIRRDRTFFAFAVEHERESAEEWSDVPGAALAPINRALATPMFARAAVRSATRDVYDTSTRGTDLTGKFNHQFGTKDTLAARYAFSRGRVRHEVQGPDNFADRSSQASSLTTDHSLVGNWLRVASPTTVNEIRLQVAERSMDLDPNSSGAMLEIPGVATMGEFYRSNSQRTERHYEAVENLNFSLGGHRLSVGADAHLIRFDGALRNRFAGLYVFPTLEDFVAGRPDIFIQAFGDPNTQMRTAPIGIWVQDRWEAVKGLHAELGLRYDRQRMPAGLPSSSDNFSPRIGLAWRPSQNRGLVLRAGFGYYFDRYPLAFLNDAVQKNGVRAFEQYAVGAEAARAFAAAQGGTLLTPLAGLAPTIYRASRDFPSTYSRKLTFGLEQAVDKNTTLSLEASSVSGYHLPRTRNAALTIPPQYLLEQTARSEYIGASVSLNRRLTNDLAYLVTYSAGRTRDDSSDFDEHPMDPSNTRRDWARSRQDQRQRFAVSGLFDFPAEQMPGVLKTVLDDISLAPILTLGSGRPINALLTTDVYRTGAYPISARPADMPRNPYLSPRTLSLDLRVMKTFKVHHDRALLQFGVESFDLTNHSNTERVSPYFAIPSGERLPTYDTTLENLPARQIQFMVQFEY